MKPSLPVSSNLLSLFIGGVSRYKIIQRCKNPALMRPRCTASCLPAARRGGRWGRGWEELFPARADETGPRPNWCYCWRCGYSCCLTATGLCFLLIS